MYSLRIHRYNFVLEMFIATRLLAHLYLPKPLLAAGKAISTNSNKKNLINSLIQIFGICDRPGQTRTEMILRIRALLGMTGVLT